MPLSESYVIGFSGNRPGPQPGRSRLEIESMRPYLLKVFELLIERSRGEGLRLILCSSIAEGADTLAAEVAIELDVPLRLVLPKPVDAFKLDFEGSPSRAWARASRIIEHGRVGKGGSSLEIVIEETASEASCYTEANRVILEQSDLGMILWNGEVTGKEGGASSMLEEMRRLGMPHILLNTTLEIPVSLHGLELSGL